MLALRRTVPGMIDSHHHLWDLSVRDQPWLTGDQPWASAEQLAPLRRSFTVADLTSAATPVGVTGTVVVQVLEDPAETADLLAVASQGAAAGGGLVSAVVGWADLAAADVEGQVAAYRSLPGGDRLAGIRHPLLAEPDPYWLGRPAVRNGLRSLATCGLCFELALFSRQLPLAVATARSAPSLTFVLDHLGNPDVEGDFRASGGVDPAWAAAIADLGRLDNVVCKLSGAHSSPVSAASLRPWFDVALRAFGPDRLMFGSDWPVSSLAAPYGEIAGVYRSLIASLTPDEQHAILDGTATRVYRLGG
jgi:L-fuconolactonase